MELTPAHWIWLAGADEDVDCHVLLRRSFELAQVPAQARLLLTAGQSYRLWVNGRPAGRGPLGSDPAWQHVDALEIAPLLRPGRNVLAVLAHNHGSSTHDLQTTRGGFLCALPATGLVSDGTWRVTRSQRHDRRAPRRFWSAGFAEVADLAADPGWEQPGYDDLAWTPAAELGPALGTWPWDRLVERPLPVFGGGTVAPLAQRRGTAEAEGAQAVDFASILPAGQGGVVWAATWIEGPLEGRLRVHGDDAFRVFLDGRPVLEQGLDPGFVRTRTWIGRDHVDQCHDGVHGGFGAREVEVQVAAGWHRLAVVVDQGRRGWGLLVGRLGTGPGWQPLPTRQAPAGAPGWTLHGPTPSTGFADALDSADPAQLGAVTGRITGTDLPGDPGPLMRHERRVLGAVTPAALPLHLAAGEAVVLDLGQVELGFPALEFAVEADAVVDLAWSNLLPEDGGIRWLGGEMMPYADRLRLPLGAQRWEPVLRRSFRYAHVVCRSGALSLRRLDLARHYCPTAVPAAFACSDALLTRLHRELVHGARLLMQERWQDCLRREMGTVNTQSFNYAAVGALLALGATDVTRHTLRSILRTQERSGWFDSHGLSGHNQDEVSECLFLHAWVRDWWWHSGDTALATELFPRLGENLEFCLRSTGRDGLLDQRLRHCMRTGEIAYLIDEINGLPGYAPPYGWSQPPPGVVPVVLLGTNLLLGAAAEALAELAPVAGYASRAPRLRRIAGRVRPALHRRCWIADEGRYASGVDGEGRFGARHPLLDLYALHFGVVPAELRGQVLDLIGRELSAERAAAQDWPASLHGSHHHLLEQHFAAGRSREALDLLRVLWGSWLDCGGTGAPEGGRPWDRRNAPLLHDEEIHAYGLGPLPLLHTRVLGVQATAAGYASLRVAPCPGDLAWAEGETQTPQGLVQVRWSVTAGGFDCHVQAPAGVPVETITPPGLRAGRITVS